MHDYSNNLFLLWCLIYQEENNHVGTFCKCDLCEVDTHGIDFFDNGIHYEKTLIGAIKYWNELMVFLRSEIEYAG